MTKEGGMDEPRYDTTGGRADSPAMALLQALLRSLSDKAMEG